jgi:hypothetical protein
MKKKSFIKKWHWRIYMMTSILIALCLGSCKESEEDGSEAAVFDPSQQVLISDFIPKTGGVGQRLVLYGENFGNDPEVIDLFIGGKKAIVIGVNGGSLYCLVPEKAYSGEIEIRGIGEHPVAATAVEKFDYQRKVVLSTLCGDKNERDDQGWKDGPFSTCVGFRNMSFMTFDPKNPKHLYIAYDGYEVQLLNFEDSVVTTPITRGMGNWNRIRSVEFTLDGEYMIIANDQSVGVTGISTSILSRANNFKDPQILTTYKQCNGASIHPVNGEMYFNSYEKGQFYRFDMNRYFNHELGVNGYDELFKIQDNSWEFKIQIHPTGNYAYIVVINQHYILRTDYNWERKTFTQPYVICGEARVSGWVDGVGSKVRLNAPYQGVFVKNPDYAGKADEYDFYFTEEYNHDIRLLTPEGKVTTFAGRGSSSLNTSPNGFVEGDLRLEARLNRPCALAYDEEHKTFYVGDLDNRRIRKIAMEEE